MTEYERCYDYFTMVYQNFDICEKVLKHFTINLVKSDAMSKTRTNCHCTTKVFFSNYCFFFLRGVIKRLERKT